MTGDNPNYRPVVAAIAASFLMLVFGLTYRALAAWLLTPLSNSNNPIDPNTLERFPMQIDSWMGQGLPLDEDIVREANADAYINRRYLRRNASDSVSLYIACGVRIDKMIRHRPEVCYPAAGWTLVDRCPMELALDGGMKLPCTIFQFSRGGLDTERVAVLDYFIADGQERGDASLLQLRLRRVFGTVDCVAQVEIVASPTGSVNADSATRIVCSFAVDSAPSMARLFKDLNKDRNGDSPRDPRQRK